MAPSSRFSFPTDFVAGRLVCTLCTVAIFAGFAGAAQGGSPPPPGEPNKAVAAPPCHLLQEDSKRGLLGDLELRLERLCGHRAGFVPAPADPAPAAAVSADAAVNDPRLDAGALFGSHTQNETALARSLATGTLCAGYNDSYHLITEENGFSGFSRSTDGGASWEDRGALGAASAGGPSLIWRRSDGFFYYAALHDGGLGLWRSADDCAGFAFAGPIPGGGSGDRLRLAVDNAPASPRYGRLYAVFTDFAGGRVVATASADGGASWSPPLPLSPAGDVVQAAWPALAPNGDLYVAWLRWQSFPDGPLGVQLARSSDGGAIFVPRAAPLAGAAVPRDPGATASCGRAALAGNLRHLPAPQLAVGEDGVLHLVYGYDPDGLDSGDASEVFYRRSADGGASWLAELRLADDATGRDQFSPALAVAGRSVVVSWYDRRHDPANLATDRYGRFSADGGRSWGPNLRLSEVSAPVRLDPDLPTCYHGDYDQQLVAADRAVALWADDRRLQDGHQDADVYSKGIALPLFGDGFESGDTAAWTATAP